MFKDSDYVLGIQCFQCELICDDRSFGWKFVNKLGWSLNPCNTLAPAFYRFLFVRGWADSHWPVWIWVSMTNFLMFGMFAGFLAYVDALWGDTQRVWGPYGETGPGARARQVFDGFICKWWEPELKHLALPSRQGKQTIWLDSQLWLMWSLFLSFLTLVFRPSLDLRKNWKRCQRPIPPRWFGICFGFCLFVASRFTSLKPTSCHEGQVRDWSYQVWRWREACVGGDGRATTNIGPSEDNQVMDEFWMILSRRFAWSFRYRREY